MSVDARWLRGMTTPRTLAVFLALQVAGCHRREDVELCAASTAKYEATFGALSEAARKAENERCVDVVDRLRTGPRDCLGRCYAKAEDREALLDCDRACQLKVQAPKPE